jgi:heme oxygenase (biliverdin-IX-beta and delta-forming)
MTVELASAESQPISSPPSSLARGRAVARRSILERLKLETAAEHAAIEGATGVMDPELSLKEYRAYLERTLGFYQVVESRLRQLGVWEALGLPAEEREKLPLLAEDIVLLGNIEPASVRTCNAPPVFASTAEAVGGAYVLEGSTLGGRVISRHVQSRFGADVPRSFLECYGAETGEKWQSFRAALSRFASSRDREDRMIAGARETFGAFTRWLER